MSVKPNVDLELPAPGNIGGKTIDKRPRFEFRGELTVTRDLRTSYLLGEGGDKAINTIANVLDDDESKYAKFHTNTGTGTRAVTVSFADWTGRSGNWGDPDSTDPPYQGDGEDALTKMEILEYFLAVTTADSASPAHLEVGGYAPGKMFDDTLNRDKMDVVLEQPNLTWAAGTGESADTITGELTFVETVSGGLVGQGTLDKLEEIADAYSRVYRDLPP